MGGGTVAMLARRDGIGWVPSAETMLPRNGSLDRPMSQLVELSLSPVCQIRQTTCHSHSRCLAQVHENTVTSFRQARHISHDSPERVMSTSRHCPRPSLTSLIYSVQHAPGNREAHGGVRGVAGRLVAWAGLSEVVRISGME